MIFVRIPKPSHVTPGKDLYGLAKAMVKTVIERLRGETVNLLLGQKLKEIESNDKENWNIKRLEV